ncbi:MAG: hypothetical protein AAB426_14835 [Myxococcota bacterium]
MSASDDKNGAVTLTRREAAALNSAATDSALLAADLEWDEIVMLRRKLRSESNVPGAVQKA